MGEISSISISGFRGINIPPLELDFMKEKSVRSIMLYGKNGTGKSSIVDAWEWIASGRIEHLRREGAKEHSYPHKEAKEGQSWVKIDLSHNDSKSILVKFDNKRVTKPLVTGDLHVLTSLISHPCHLRYRDLTEFVYKTKAEKYEFFSQQMGFGNDLIIQNKLKTCQGRLEEEKKKKSRDLDELRKEYKETLGVSPRNDNDFNARMNELFERNGIQQITTLNEFKTSFAIFKKEVEEDERSKLFSMNVEIKGIIERFFPFKDIKLEISSFFDDVRSFRKREAEISNLSLLQLYDTGIESLDIVEDKKVCPLCDQPYDGNLKEHIIKKQSHFEGLRKKKDLLDEQKEKIIDSIRIMTKELSRAKENLDKKELQGNLTKFNAAIIDLDKSLLIINKNLESTLLEMDIEMNLDDIINQGKYQFILESELILKEEIQESVDKYEGDDHRKRLVDDYNLISDSIRVYRSWKRTKQQLQKLDAFFSDFLKIKNAYVDEIKSSVQTSFDSISSDVANYFRVLEKYTPNLEDPKIILDFDKEKAVELEVVFGNEVISPAYKYLSESQLNSFGLAIFLASVKNFNVNFKFFILDDVINSFDGYKRPRVIDLLSRYFSDYQILLFTHDKLWLDRLQRNFPKWIRIHIDKWDYITGPSIKPGKSTFEQINDFIEKDYASEAGRTFGVYLEYVLQELCENMEASLKYNRRNEFTLADLFTAFRTRMNVKLKTSEVNTMITKFEADTIFRNYCAHWKDPEIPFTSVEVMEIVEKWKVLENHIECEKCKKFIEYSKESGHEHVSCPCRMLTLT